MQPLIAPQDLAAALHDKNPPVLLDVRWKLGGPPAREAYDCGHLPGAVFIDLDTDLADTPGERGRHPLPDPAALERTLRRAGVCADSDVVVYDAGDGSSAARAWWLLRWAGHERVAVLNGGYAAWHALGLPETEEEPRPTPGDIRVRPGAMPVLDVEQAAARGREGVLLDARAPARYRGSSEPVDHRAGHIPGAVNAPFSEHLGENGYWLPPAQLAARFRELGVSADFPVGAYCGSGVTASSVVLALEHAGVCSPERPAALYAGSWSHWSRDPERPVATGDQPG